VSTVARSSLHIEVRTAEQGPVIRLVGDLDVSTAPELWACIEELEDPRAVTELDLGDLDFVDSSGISCLFRLHQRVADAGGMVVARRPTPQIRRMLEMTQLTRLIAVLD
jgi:anti-anti-sigma factor